MLTGHIAAPSAASSPISVPLAELFNVALEYERGGRLADAERMLGHVLAAAPTQAEACGRAAILPEDGMSMNGATNWRARA